jgi:hypothetical protein
MRNSQNPSSASGTAASNLSDLSDLSNLSNLSDLSTSDLAEVLFTSSLQESDNPSPHEVRAAVEEALRVCGGNCAVCAACVAQEAGDHPEGCARRMRWALRAVESAYASPQLLAA